MKHKGFTLVEVLVVFLVLGIIAVLTLPAIMSNIQKHQVGPALTKAMATLETAHALMANEHEMDNISDGCNIGAHGSLFGGNGVVNVQNYRINCFEPYVMKMIGASKETNGIKYDKFNNTGVSINTGSTSYHKYTTKSGVTYYFLNGGIISGKHAMMQFYIDINGMNKKPNVMGKDLFQAVIDLDSTGAVAPYGGHIYSDWTWGYYNVNNFSVWNTSCNSTTPINNITGETCSGSVIDNGGKVIYPWK